MDETETTDRAFSAEEKEALTDWLVEQGLKAETLAAVFDGLCARLVALGLPLLRGHTSVTTIHPNFSGLGCTWWRSGDAESERYQHIDTSLDRRWHQSPFRVMVEEGVPRLRRRLVGPKAKLDFPVLEEFRAQGGTDWLAQILAFRRLDEAAEIQGIIFSWLSDAPEGFTAEQKRLLDWLVPRMALVAYRIGAEQVAVNVLDAYVGRDAGRRILRGQIQRGAAVGLDAAILFADLRGFTAMTESLPGDRVMAGLNEYLGSVTDAVEARGGEVLKFLGDGLLAVFSLAGRELEAVCGDALDAAEDALADNAVINLRRRKAGEPALSLDLALHVGEVMYGNVGSASRLDFTVIGPAVNEASRMEALCDPLDCPLILSEPFARACGRPLRSLGRHVLRGIAGEKELFTTVGDDGDV